MPIYTTLFLAFIIGVITAYIANQRGRNLFFWFVMGVLFGVIGLLFLLILPDRNEMRKKMLKEMELEEAELELKDGKEGKREEEKIDYKKDGWYYIDQAREQKGAISFKELQRLWSEGKVIEDNYVWIDGMENWLKIEEIPELREVLER